MRHYPGGFDGIVGGAFADRPDFQNRFERFSGVGFGRAGDGFGRTGGDDPPAFVAGFRSEVDDPVGGLDDVEVVLDADDGVAEIHQAMQDVEQLPEVVKVQAGGGFVEDVERLAGRGLGEFGGELNALGFSTGEGRGGLAQGEVAQADVFERLEDAANLGDVFEQGQRLVDAWSARRQCSFRGTGPQAFRGHSGLRRSFRNRSTRRAGSAFRYSVVPFPRRLRSDRRGG